MNVSIDDADMLRSVSVVDIASYLRTRKWKLLRRLGDHARIWRLQSGRGSYEVVVPSRTGMVDYAARIADILGTLATVERRGELEVLNDIILTLMDVIRLPRHDPDSASGSVRIQDGVPMFERAMEMVLAAACSTTQRRAHFGSRKPAEASRYLETVRLGQTERSSYVVTVLSPLPAQLQDRMHGEAAVGVDDPFSRRVTRTLAGSLQALTHVTESVIGGGLTRNYLEYAVLEGVSANLCEAVAGLAGHEDGAEVSVAISWAPVLEAPRGLAQEAHFSQDAIAVARETAELLKEQAPPEIESIVGPIVRLERAPSVDAPGTATVLAYVEGLWRRIPVSLNPEQYHRAVDAHGANRVVTCEGIVERANRRLFMSRLVDFVVENEQDGIQ